MAKILQLTISTCVLVSVIVVGGLVMLPAPAQAEPSTLKLVAPARYPGRRKGYTKKIQAKIERAREHNLEFFRTDARSVQETKFEYDLALEQISNAPIRCQPKRLLGTGRFGRIVLAEMEGRPVAIKAYISERRLLSDTRELKEAKAGGELVAQHLYALPEHRIQIYQYVEGPTMETIISARSAVFTGPEYGQILKWYDLRTRRAVVNTHDQNYIFETKTGQIYLIDPF